MNDELRRTIQNVLEQALEETGTEITNTTARVARYATERALHLSTLVADPGYELAVVAERDNVALFAGLDLTGNADAMEQRVVGLIHGALSLGVQLLLKA